jgi:hypothetical protein
MYIYLDCRREEKDAWQGRERRRILDYLRHWFTKRHPLVAAPPDRQVAEITPLTARDLLPGAVTEYSRFLRHPDRRRCR